MTSLHPFYKVGFQIAEAILEHQEISKDEAFDQAVEMLARVNIPHPKDRANQYPHEFSGGMRQRAMIAMALSLNPDVLIADEPTTALDVTVQAQILDLIDRLKSEFNAAVIIITHDLGVVAEHCDDIMVMYAGKAAEFGNTDDIYYKPLHPYTWGLLSSIPRLDDTKQERLNPIRGLPPSLIQVPPGLRVPSPMPVQVRPVRSRRSRAPPRGRPPRGCVPLEPRRQGEDPGRGGLGPSMSVQAEQLPARSPAPSGEPLVKLEGIKKYFPITQGILFQHHVGNVHAVDDVDLEVYPGQTVGSRRGDRLRQVHAGPSGDAALRRHGRQGLVQRPGHHPPEGHGAPGAPRRHADGVPGPVCVAEPPEDRGFDRRASRSACTRPCHGTGSSPRSSS